MKPAGKDPFIEEVDRELRSIDVRLKKVMSDAEALLRELSQDTGEPEDGDEKETSTL